MPHASAFDVEAGEEVVGVTYEAKPLRTAFTKPEPWWAFLISYGNFRLSIVTFFFWGSCVAFHQAATSYTLYRGTMVHREMATQAPLHDVGHEWLPNTQRYRVIPEIGHVWPVLYLSGLMLYNFDQRSLDCFRTFLWCHGTLFLMRASSFTATMLPDSSQQCHTSMFVGSCHDLVFSGHVMIMTLSVLATHHFFPEALPLFLRWALIINNVVTSIMIVSCRNHYTVDVLLALFITPFVFTTWTRHPVLASLSCINPATVLALESKLAASPRATAILCGCETRRRRVRLTPQGYPTPTGTALTRLTQHAHAALSLLGLRPRLVIFRNGRPVYDDGAHEASAGLSEDRNMEEYAGETSGAVVGVNLSPVVAGDLRRRRAGLEARRPLSQQLHGPAGHHHEGSVEGDGDPRETKDSVS